MQNKTKNKKKQKKKKMQENDENEKDRIKNRMCYYFDDIIKLESFDIEDILIDEKWHENMLIYDISYKVLIGSKSLRIKFNKIDGIIRIHGGNRCFTLFDTTKYDTIYDGMRFRISLKSTITYILSHYFTEVKVDSLKKKYWLYIML